ncbi:MAG: 50S ribosomal protein L24 [Candidatus Azambacteria bacterium]|nr:50S ribosomal protein L24 [Candidatus Azambacteria bacterium]
MKVKKGDKVIITAGKDRGKSGKIMQAIPSDGAVVVQSLNMRKVHIRPKKQGEKGQIISKESPLDVSNVMLICPQCSKPTRVGYQVSKGSKSRVCKKCKETI